MPKEVVGSASKETFDVLADIVQKTGNGTFTLDELKRFAKREHPFSPARLSKRKYAEWEEFYRDVVGFEVDLSDVVIPDDPGGFSRVLVIAKGLTIAQVIAACRKHFKVWLYRDDLGEAVTENDRSPANGSYAIRVRDRVEADEELKNLSANDIKERGTATMTLLERLLFESKYFKETGKHLDINNWTLCAGSRYSSGGVPRLSWFSGSDGLFVDWCSPDYRSGSIRTRAVVS